MNFLKKWIKSFIEDKPVLSNGYSYHFDDFGAYVSINFPDLYAKIHCLNIPETRIILNKYTGLNIQGNDGADWAFKQYRIRLEEIRRDETIRSKSKKIRIIKRNKKILKDKND
jgi:hypothetical protein